MQWGLTSASVACFLSIITIGDAAPIADVPSTTWTTLGCYTDSVTTRTLRNRADTAGGFNSLTVGLCQAKCSELGFDLAGLEFGGECYCDNAIRYDRVPVSSTQCFMACNGDSTQTCGAPDRISIYASSSLSAAPATWKYTSCFADSVATRSLPIVAQVPGGWASVTVESCTAACLDLGYKLAGMEYSRECFCGNSLRAGSIEASSGCDMPCSGDPSQICGGSDRLSVYTYNVSPSLPNADATSTSTSTSTSSTTSVDTSTTTTTSSSATATSSIGPENPVATWSFAGCYTDSVAERTFGTQPGYLAYDNMTLASCQIACATAGFTLAGLEYGGECFCDKNYNGDGVLADPRTCYMPCKGDASEICGGPDRLSVYALTTTVNYEWQSAGCVSDVVSARTLAFAVDVLGGFNGMTIEKCQSSCQRAGYSIAGLEYTGECFCDNTYRNGGIVVDDGCTMACNGDKTQICGGSNRLSVYKLNAVIFPSPSSTISSTTPSISATSGENGSTTSSDSSTTSTSTSVSTTSTRPACAIATGINIIPDPSFELGSVVGRTFSNTGFMHSFAPDYSNFKSGLRSMVFRPMANQEMWITQQLTLIPTTTYHFSAWTRDYTLNGLCITQFTIDDVVLATRSDYTRMTWVETSAQYTASKIAAELKIEVICASPSAGARLLGLDDLFLAPLSLETEGCDSTLPQPTPPQPTAPTQPTETATVTVVASTL